jgi:hypothetical protein
MGNAQGFFDDINRRMPGKALSCFKEGYAITMGSYMLENELADAMDCYLVFDLESGLVNVEKNGESSSTPTAMVALLNGSGGRCVEFLTDNDRILKYRSNISYFIILSH